MEQGRHRKQPTYVRQVLKQLLRDFGTRRVTRPIELVRDLLGAVESGVPDLGQRHRQHLLSRLPRR